MKICTYNITRTIIACTVTLLVGAPAIADDTELLLVNPDPANKPNSNVLFILDTSGSMASNTEATAQPYDNAITYTGTCNTNALYWTDVDVTPACDISNTQIVNKTSFHCDFATRQVNGIGSFTNTMAQYRSEGGAPETWQYLAPGNATDPVECQADSGVHGDGTAGQVYAASGSDLTNPWTGNAGAEVSWGSAPRNLAYTVFDGNYLNWKSNPVIVNLQRTVIMKTVIKKVLESVDNLNVGLMRFNDGDGGTVIHAIEDLATGRSSIIAAVDNLPASGPTPLSEVLYESALYWQGLPAFYGENFDTVPTDPNALVSPAPATEVYKQPVTEACTKNYNVLLSDGVPNNDAQAESLVPNLPDFSDTLGGRTACTNAGTDGSCMDDVTEYLSLVDIDPDTPEVQTVTTHTIGFAVDLAILRDTAEISGGQYFLADDIESLTLALLQILANINDRSLSFSAPAVSVNTFNRTQNLNNLYMTMFGARTRAHWPGNLKKYTIAGRVITDADGTAAVDPATGFFFDTSRSIWTSGADDGNDVRLGGAANLLPDPTVRNLYTNNTSDKDLTAVVNQITPSNAASFADSDFGLTGATGEPTKDDVIRWMRGEDVRDEDNNAATTVRNAMGDPLHSQPAAIVYGGSAAAPDVVIYTATNDGYLHAIDGDTGTELWSFVPKELLTNMTRLFFDPAAKFKQYGLDGNVVPIVKDENNDGIVNGANDFVYLIFGMRRGGSSYYALDVTDKNSPQLLWIKNMIDAGQSWSSPVVAKINIGGATQNADKAVVVIGGGYDTVHDTAAHPSSPDSSGAGIHILDLESGNLLWRAGPDSSANLKLSEMTRSIPNEVRVIDVSGDGLADRMYASDMGGQLWRFDIFNGKSASGTGTDALITGGVIAQLGGEGTSNPASDITRRFYNAPDISLFNDIVQDKRFIAISIGSGYRSHPFDLTATDQFFSIRDEHVFNSLTQAAYDNFPIITESDLIDVSGKKEVVITNNDSGWRFTLPANQKVLADSVTFDGSVFFVAFSPDSAAAENCSAGRGTNFLYRVSVVNGDPVVNNLDTLDPADADDARQETLAQGGIAPTPTILFPSPDDPNACVGAQCSPPPIMCVGVECGDPNFENNPVRTLWTQNGIE